MITTIVNNEEARVESSDNCNNSNILRDLLGNGNNFGPAPLQSIAIPTDTFEVIADVLNTSIRGIGDTNIATKEHHGITSVLENPIMNDCSGDESISAHILTQNIITITLQ